MSIHTKRFDAGFNVIMATLIIIGLAALGYGLIHSLIYEAGFGAVIIVAIVSGGALLMYIVGFVIEKIHRLTNKEDKQ